MKLVNGVYVWDGAVIAGDVQIGQGTNVWPFVSIRGDVAPIRVGENCSIQDQVTLHCRHKVQLDVGDDVVIGHQACVHCRSIGDGALIGIGSRILDHATIGAGALVAAGAVVKPGFHVPDGMMAAGVPARVIRPVSDEERGWMADIASRYCQLADDHLAGKFPAFRSHDH